MSHIAIYGHTYTRVFTYTEGGKYNEYSLPARAALIAKVINGHWIGLPSVELITLDETYRCEHLKLGLFEDKKVKSYESKDWKDSDHGIRCIYLVQEQR
jgi:hypothetical protein